MKTTINRITIDAEFTTIQELKALLFKVVNNYEKRHREYKSPFVKWIAYKKENEQEGKVTIGDFNGMPIKFEEIDGERYLVLESKLNNM